MLLVEGDEVGDIIVVIFAGGEPDLGIVGVIQ